MWRERIQAVKNSVVFHEPANHSTLIKVESELNASLPDDLRKLLLESDGIDGEYGLGLIWSSTRILAENINFRSRSEVLRYLYAF